MICKLIGFLLVTLVASTPLRFNDIGESIKFYSASFANRFTHCSTAPLLGADLPEIIPDEYIVVFEPIDHVSSEQGIVSVVAKPHVMAHGLKVEARTAILFAIHRIQSCNMLLHQ